MSITLVPTEDQDTWQALLAVREGATCFHDWSWLELQADLFGWRFQPLLVVDDQEPIGVFPVMRRPRPALRPVVPPFPFLGPLVPPDTLVETLKALRRWQLRERLLLVQFEFGPDRSADLTRAITSARCERAVDKTYVVDLSHGSEERLLAGMTSEVRRRLRKAAANGVQARVSEPGEVSDLLPRVMKEAFAGRGMASHYPSSIGQKVERWLATRDDVYAGTAFVHDEPAGVIVALASRPVMLGWVGGCFRKHRSANANTVLIHHSFLWGMHRGHTAIDMVARVDEGVGKFKMSLGGVEKTYLRAWTSPMLPPAVLSFGDRTWARARSRGLVTDRDSRSVRE